MKNYFSWKKKVIKSRQDLIREASQRPDSTSESVQATLSSDDRFTSISKQHSYTQTSESSGNCSNGGNEFKVRTLEVLTAEMHRKNAVLLCSFAIPEMCSNFIAYSLNECIEGSKIRVYVARLYYSNGIYTLGAHAPNPGWLSALARIIGESGGDKESISRDKTLTTYHLIDMEPKLLNGGVMAHHSTIDIDRASVTKVIFWRGKSSGPAIEHCTIDVRPTGPEIDISRDASTVMTSLDEVGSQVKEIPSEQNIENTIKNTVVGSEPVLKAGHLSAQLSKPSSMLSQGKLFSIEKCHELQDDIEKTLGSIDEMTEGFEQHFHASIKHLERQESVQKLLIEKDLQLTEQEHRLALNNAAVNEERKRMEVLSYSLIAREADLKEREVRLATLQEELTQGFNQLSVSRTKLSDVVKKLHASMQRKSEQLREPFGTLASAD